MGTSIPLFLLRQAIVVFGICTSETNSVVEYASEFGADICMWDWRGNKVGGIVVDVYGSDVSKCKISGMEEIWIEDGSNYK